MTKYTYTASNPCHITLKIGDDYVPFSFHKGEVYDLPDNNKVVIRMEAQGLFTPVSITPKKTKNNGS